MNVITSFKGIDSSPALTLKTEKKLARFSNILGSDTEIAVTYWAYGKKRSVTRKLTRVDRNFLQKLIPIASGNHFPS